MHHGLRMKDRKGFGIATWISKCDSRISGVKPGKSLPTSVLYVVSSNPKDATGAKGGNLALLWVGRMVYSFLC